jgi:hypothetical protein
MGIVVHTCNSSALEAEAGGLRDGGQSGLHSKSLSQKWSGGQECCLMVNSRKIAKIFVKTVCQKKRTQRI